MVARKRLNGAAPPKDVNDPVLLGREAWERRKTETKNSWKDWKLIGKALLVGRRKAMAEAKMNRPAGRKYNVLFGHWIQTNGFDEIDKSDRSKLLQIVENLDEIEAWRKTLTASQSTQLNHPSSVWRAWICPNRGNRGKPKADEEQPTENVADATEPDDEEAAEIEWQRVLIVRARKSIGDAHLNGFWLGSAPPDSGLIEVVQKAAQEWAILAEYLASIRHASPEDLAEARESFAKGQSNEAEHKARKTERGKRQSDRWREEADKVWAGPN